VIDEWDFYGPDVFQTSDATAVKEISKLLGIVVAEVLLLRCPSCRSESSLKN